jgi:hypothetical protein
MTRLMQLAEMADDGMSKVWQSAGGLDCAVIVIAMALCCAIPLSCCKSWNWVGCLWGRDW